MSEWISVKDKMPPFNQRVLIYLTICPIGVCTEDYICFATWSDGEKEDPGALWILEAKEGDAFVPHEESFITHWMPLPAFPTSEPQSPR